MLKITCPDGIDLKFLDERHLDVSFVAGELIIVNNVTKEKVLHLAEGKWSNVITEESFATYVPPNTEIRITG